jgi:hypothetical protein
VTTLATRTCETTGLRLIADPGVYGYHVGKSEYPALSAASRDAAAKSRTAWNRYDVPGQTFYIAETRECAYAEVLSPFKRANGASDPLAGDAAFLGMTLEEYVEEVTREWSERDLMGLGAIPAGWRYDRGMIPVAMPDGWLIDIEHPDSISAIERMMASELASLGVPQLTTATLRGDDRAVTTAIATRLRGAMLDTGRRPFGIHFGSKHGAGWCKAVWLDHPDASNILALSPEPILVTDNALKTAADRFRIRVF